MKIFPLRTWHRLCSLTPLLAFAILGLWLLPSTSRWQLLALPLSGVLVSIALLGAWQGWLLTRRRLEFGCPQCLKNAFVTAADKKCWQLDCPTCGPLTVHTGWRTLRIASPPKKRPRPRSKK
jgi:hypothetical protein